MSILCCVRSARTSRSKHGYVYMFNCICVAAIQIVRRFLSAHCFQLKIDSLRRWIWYTNNRSHFNEPNRQNIDAKWKIDQPERASSSPFRISNIRFPIDQLVSTFVRTQVPNCRKTDFLGVEICARRIFGVVFSIIFLLFEKSTVKSIKDSKHN